MTTKKLDPEIEKQIADMVGTMTRLLDKMILSHETVLSNNAEGKAKVIILEAALASAKESINKIIKLLHEGNGERPLVTRVSILETITEEAERDIGRLYDKIDALTEKVASLELKAETIDTKTDTTKKDSKINKELVISLISAISAIVAAYLAST